MAAVRMRTRQTLGCVSNQLGRSPSDSNGSLFPDFSRERVGFRGAFDKKAYSDPS